MSEPVLLRGPVSIANLAAAAGAFTDDDGLWWPCLDITFRTPVPTSITKITAQVRERGSDAGKNPPIAQQVLTAAELAAGEAKIVNGVSVGQHLEVRLLPAGAPGLRFQATPWVPATTPWDALVAGLDGLKVGCVRIVCGAGEPTRTDLPVGSLYVEEGGGQLWQYVADKEVDVSAVNIAGPDITSPTNIVTISTDATHTLRFSKPLAADSDGLLTWDAYSPWPNNGSNGGLTWLNDVNIYGNNGGADELLFSFGSFPSFYATIANAFAALAAELPVTLTGYSTYKVEAIPDPNPPDDRGGLSLLVETVTPGWVKKSDLTSIKSEGVETEATPRSLNFVGATVTTDDEHNVTVEIDAGGAPGGSSGQIQYNNAGVFGGFTVGGDATLNTGTGALTIANDAVTYAKMQNISAASKLLGRGDSGAGDPQEIALGAGLSMVGNTLTGTSSGGTITTASIIVPQGRLSLVTGVPVMFSDQTAKTHIFYTPYSGPNVPIYDGSTWTLYSLSADLDLTLDTSNHLAEKIHDIFIWNDSGVIRIGAGPAWANTATITVTIATPAVVSWTGHGLPEGAPVIFTSSGALPTGITAGTTYYVGRSPGANSFNISTSVANAAAGTFVATSGSQSGTHTGANATTLRGTGAGTTELQMLDGIWTNKNAITLTNGAGAGTSVPANRATYVGSAYMTANGQTAMVFAPASASGGTNNILGLYNAYNRVSVVSVLVDTASGTYGSTTVRAFGGSVLCRISWLDGLQQSAAQVSTNAAIAVSSASFGGRVGTAFNATNAEPTASVGQDGSGFINAGTMVVSPPRLGFNYGQNVQAVSGAANKNFFGCGITLRIEM